MKIRERIPSHGTLIGIGAGVAVSLLVFLLVGNFVLTAEVRNVQVSNSGIVRVTSEQVMATANVARELKGDEQAQQKGDQTVSSILLAAEVAVQALEQQEASICQAEPGCKIPPSISITAPGQGAPFPPATTTTTAPPKGKKK